MNVITQRELKESTNKKRDNKARVFTWKDLMDGSGEIDWLVEGLYSFGSVVTVNGKPGSKKTLSIMDFAVSVANGEKEWLGFPIKKYVPVLLVDEESGDKRLSLRFKEIAKGHNVKKGLNITSTCISGFNFKDGNDVVELSQLMKSTGARLVIIDTLTDVLAGGDDNASKDINPLYKGLRMLADHYNALIIIIHHNNKMGSYRGSTAIEGSSDLMIQISSKQDSPNIDFEITKKRDDIRRTKWSAYIYSPDNSFLLRSSDKPMYKLGKVQEHVINYLNDYDKATIEDLQANNGGHSKSSIKGAVYKLIEQKLAMPSGYTGKKKIYTLSPDGKMYAETLSSIPVIFAEMNKK